MHLIQNGKMIYCIWLYAFFFVADGSHVVGNGDFPVSDRDP